MMNNKEKYPIPSTQIQHIILPFGKYKGYRLYELVNYAPAYVVWLHEKSGYKVPEEVINAALYVLENRKYIAPETGEKPYKNFALTGWGDNSTQQNKI